MWEPGDLGIWMRDDDEDGAIGGGGAKPEWGNPPSPTKGESGVMAISIPDLLSAPKISQCLHECQ